MKILPGKLIVIEGLDKSGKSTFVERLKLNLPHLYEGTLPFFTHSPSGHTRVGTYMYAITEHQPMNSLSRQLMHLASHSEEYEKHIIPALTDRAVIMDRNWWSTVAYGLFGGQLREWIKDEDFLKMAQLPTRGLQPDMVVLFMETYETDAHNNPDVTAGYWWLAERFPQKVVIMPHVEVDEKVKLFRSSMHAMGLAE